MRHLKIIVAIIVGMSFQFVVAQTAEFTVLSILKLSSNNNHDICQDFIKYDDLQLNRKENGNCIFNCKLNSVKIKADSIIFMTGTALPEIFDPFSTLSLTQYFNNPDSVITEYNSYLNRLTQLFDSNSTLNNYKIIKTKEFQIDDKSQEKSNKSYEYFNITTIEIRSQAVLSNITIEAVKMKNVYVLWTQILNLQ